MTGVLAPHFRNGVSAQYYVTDDLPSHMALVKRQIDKSLLDPRSINLARKLVSGSFDWIEDPKTGRRVQVLEEWGKRFWAPTQATCLPKDDACELAVFWEFLVTNMRYTYDPDNADTFSTLEQALLAGSEDCDGAVVCFGTLARAVGFSSVIARVVSMNGEQYEHVFPLIGCPKDRPSVYIPMDMTVAGAPLGWQVKGAAAVEDFDMSGPVDE